jgi:hypothetical protein
MGEIEDMKPSKQTRKKSSDVKYNRRLRQLKQLKSNIKLLQH